MSRFICFVGEDPEIFVSDDESVIQMYKEDEWFVCYDSQENVWFRWDSGMKPKEPKVLPEIEQEEYEGDGEDE